MRGWECSCKRRGCIFSRSLILGSCHGSSWGVKSGGVKDVTMRSSYLSQRDVSAAGKSVVLHTSLTLAAYIQVPGKIRCEISSLASVDGLTVKISGSLIL